MAALKFDKGVKTEEKPEEVESRVADEPEKTLFAWEAPARPFKRRDREFYVTVVSIFVIIGLVLFLAEGPVPVILLVSFLFLVYVLNTVEPEKVEYRITNKGVKIAERETYWMNIRRFWFSGRLDTSLVVFETLTIPGRLELVVEKNDEERIREILAKFLKEEEVPPSFLDKATNWFNKKLPGGNLA
jgi:hypothetical protein